LRLLLVGIGGFVGSVLRYWIGGIVQHAAPRSAFPVGTLAVNVVGCFAIGVVVELAESRDFLTPERHALLVVGLLGGFTTFSAFANDSLTAIRTGAFGVAFANVLLSVGVCLAAVWAGRSAAHAIWR
jgi:CrcB protein